MCGMHCNKDTKKMAKDNRQKIRRQKMKFSYDSKMDDLFIFDTSSKSKGSIEIGDLILDLDKNKKIVGVEIINATKFLKNLDVKITKAFLEGLKNAKFDLAKQKNWTFLKINLTSANQKLNPIVSVAF